MTESSAVRVLTARAAAVERTPITFTADSQPFTLSPPSSASSPTGAPRCVAAAEGSGFGPLRGFKRLQARVFGISVTPPVKSYDAAVRYKLAQIADGSTARVSTPRSSARASTSGSSRGCPAASSTAPLPRPPRRRARPFDRDKAVALPVVTTEPKVNSDDLEDAATQARTALSAPIRLSYGETRWRVPRWRIAPLLSLPSGGTTTVSISGRGAEQYLERLSATVSRKPQDAHFQVTATGKIVIRPSAPGLQLDLPATAKAIAAAAFSADKRTANLVVQVAEPKRTTEIAKTMGITSVVSSYTTTYGGTPGASTTSSSSPS